MSKGSLNKQSLLYATHNYPTFFTTTELERFEQEKPKVTLQVYDFSTDTFDQVTTTHGKMIRFNWVNPTSLEYWLEGEESKYWVLK